MPDEGTKIVVNLNSEVTKTEDLFPFPRLEQNCFEDGLHWSEYIIL